MAATHLLSGTWPLVCVLLLASEVPLAYVPYKTVLAVCWLLLSSRRSLRAYVYYVSPSSLYGIVTKVRTAHAWNREYRVV